MIARSLRPVLLILFVLAASAIPLSAQEVIATSAEPRTIGALSNAFIGGNPVIIRMPDAVDGLDISSFTVEAGEPAVSCAAGPLSHTAWFKVIHPGGTLDINTAFSTGSAFDSVVQLFADNAGVFSALNELGCDNDTGGGSSANDARLIMPNLPSAAYLVRIGCIALCGGTTDLALHVSFASPDTPPSNDSVDFAVPVKIGKVITEQNAELTTVGASENSSLSCIIYNTVWYTMIVPETGVYSFTTFGSNVQSGVISPSDTKLAVYSSSDGPVFTNFEELGCSDDYGITIGYSAIQGLSLTAGTEIFVRVGSLTSRNLLDGSFYRLKTTFASLTNVLDNESFEAGSLTPWTMAVTDGLQGVTNVYAFHGSYSARMTGQTGQTNTLKQKWSPKAQDIKLAKKSIVEGSFYYSTNGTTSSKLKATLKIIYSNGASPTSQKVKLQSTTATSTFQSAYVVATVKNSQVANIALSIKNKSPEGLVFIDYVTLTIFGDPARDAKTAPDGVLPPPAPPSGLRGMN